MPTVSIDIVSTLEADQEKASFEASGQAEALSFCFLGKAHDVKESATLEYIVSIQFIYFDEMNRIIA